MGALQIAQGLKSSTLYVLHVSNFSKNVICIAKQPSVSLWHRRLGHMSKAGMQVLSCFGFIPGLNFSDFSICEHCLYGKQTANSHSVVSQKRCEPLELVHSDVCGPMPTVSLRGAHYFVTFIDDFSHKVWAYPLKRKDEVLSVFKKFVTLVETETGKKVKCLRSDNGGEYISKSFVDFCDTKGIKRELTAPYTPPQNGVAERMNRIIQERVRSMLSESG